MEKNSKSWHLEVISSEVADTARRLAAVPALRNFYLAGGTALALHLGHRLSVDLDFFSAEPFEEDRLVANVESLPALTVISKAPQTVYLHVSHTKVSFITYPYPPLFPLEYFQGMAVGEARDIACMKLSALASRGSRRDFIDLYVAAQAYGLPQILNLFQQKFAKAHYSMLHLEKSLTYFDDAEKEAMPHMLTPLSWKEVKGFFLREVPKLHAS